MLDGHVNLFIKNSFNDLFSVAKCIITLANDFVITRLYFSIFVIGPNNIQRFQLYLSADVNADLDLLDPFIQSSIVCDCFL